MADKIEVEMKFRVENHDKFSHIIPMWTSHVNETDTYFTHPKKDLVAADQWLRVRKTFEVTGIPEIYYLVYKGVLLDTDAKSRREINIECKDDPTPVLLALGYTPLVCVKKKRFEIKIMETQPFLTLCLDEVEELGNFVEIEAVVDEQDKDAAVATVKAYAEKWGLVEQEKKGYARLALQRSQSKCCS